MTIGRAQRVDGREACPQVRNTGPWTNCRRRIGAATFDSMHIPHILTPVVRDVDGAMLIAICGWKLS